MFRCQETGWVRNGWTSWQISRSAHGARARDSGRAAFFLPPAWHQDGDAARVARRAIGLDDRLPQFENQTADWSLAGEGDVVILADADEAVLLEHADRAGVVGRGVRKERTDRVHLEEQGQRA